jgi:signal transduction histidine kinase
VSVSATETLSSSSFGAFRSTTRVAGFVFVAYLLGAELAFLIGTFSGRTFTPLWPPSIILLAALLTIARDRPWVCIAAAFPAHLIAEIPIGVPWLQALVGFVASAVFAVASSRIVLLFLGARPWFGATWKVVRYVVLIGFLCSAVSAAIGAIGPAIGSGQLDQYLAHWSRFFTSTALGALTLGPVAILLADSGEKQFWPHELKRQVEAIVLLFVLAILTLAALRASEGHAADMFLPLLLYAPIPFIAWLSIRFGVAGAGASILTVAVVLIWNELKGANPFIAGDPESSVLALQVFLISIAVPVLFLGAAFEQTQVVEEKLAEDEEWITLAASAASAGFYRYESELQSFWLSSTARSLFGLPKTGSVTRDQILAAVHPDDVPLVFAKFCNKEKSEGSSVEFRLAAHDGNSRWILSRSRTRPGKHKNTHSISGILLDVTARKLAEAESEQRRRELAHLMRVSQMGELSGGLAHELSQPLTAILARAEVARLLLDSKPCDLKAVAATLDNIISEDQRASDIIKRMRSLLKNKETGIELVDINELCQGIRTLLHMELINRGATLKIEAAPDLPNVFADSVQLQQVLINLVMNAIEAAQSVEASRRHVVMRLRKLGADNIEIAVQDSGPGISPDEQAHLLEPFFTTKERGLGLGLSICATILRRHGGTLSIENNEGGGATAFLRLPIRPVGVHVS